MVRALLSAFASNSHRVETPVDHEFGAGDVRGFWPAFAPHRHNRLQRLYRSFVIGTPPPGRYANRERSRRLTRPTLAGLHQARICYARVLAGAQQLSIIRGQHCFGMFGNVG